ncbi:F-box domain protein [Aspergillus fischeri NRRL 181]|uniref:F-box domain protein n=1 Tax=Neosartorya fischeri (strain ATCC 1020 / DSM 3700 / CBS 544.65 / FGSC A1164 / JCM 1740 / NRRL 181 / WB 181) TaxID=331117 RepID=A1D0Q8_NEOFI|nr:F-box domain protein [Aspergillus fischeri NRRL 181]EAW24578.1 F-box domain protein [Aspergillus fischeri NRRL 181]
MRQYRLPLEIISLVISYLDVSTSSSLVPYATVSREWQACIEQRTFAILKLNSPQRLEEFCQIVACNKQRQIYVRELHLLIHLEPYDIKARAYFETAAEHSRNNEIFVQTMQKVLQILSTWPENHRGIKLSIQAQSPGDPVRGDRQRLKRARHTPEEDLLDRRFERSYLQNMDLTLKDNEKRDQELRKRNRDVTELFTAAYIIVSE